MLQKGGTTLSRRRRKANISESLYSLIILGAIFVWFITKSLLFAIFVFAVIISIPILINIYIRKKRTERLLASGIDIVDRMSGEEFEKFLKAHFTNLGYKVELTPVTCDYGCDLILIKDGIKSVVQAKRYTDTVGIKAIQEIIGAMQYYRAQSAMVVTNSFFTTNARELADRSNVILWDRNILVEVMSRCNGRIESLKVKVSENKEIKECPKCKAELVTRRGNRGSFLGCSNFPNCRYTQDL